MIFTEQSAIYSLVGRGIYGGERRSQRSPFMLPSKQSLVTLN
ncbi:MAG TPA: hypothetical protein V6D43_21085 [Candidatus Sericytochromatia bacterium]